MNRRSLPVAAALTTAATLLLTACGGGGDSKSKDSDKIAGADTGTSKPSSPSPSASTAPGRPKVTLPADLKMVFEPARTGDPAQDAVLADGAERMRAVNGAITGGDPKYAAVNFYNKGRALEAASTWIEKFKKAGYSLTGSINYFDRKATVKNDSASLIFCADESKAYSKVIKTGKAKMTVPSKNDFILYNTELEKNSDGVWQTTRIVSTAGAAKCVQ
ncbi:hypothetical protein AB0M87_04085 [Streptomyces sp. NPDC051320]|uniref:hypothetical protein n=1 Tax=Streptomyces sp. NPDC051320 TaxID=3154644 RepID=UPI00344334AD